MGETKECPPVVEVLEHDTAESSSHAEGSKEKE